MSTNIHEPSSVRSAADLPPPRDRKDIRPVSPPFANVSFHTFSHYLTGGAVLLLAFYLWRLTVWKGEAGGWWNLALGRTPGANPMLGKNQADAYDAGSQGNAYQGSADGGAGAGKAGDDKTVQNRIEDLARALGMPPTDLASAIANAVHQHVPPASLSSVSASQTG